MLPLPSSLYTYADKKEKGGRFRATAFGFTPGAIRYSAPSTKSGICAFGRGVLSSQQEATSLERLSNCP
jgi:hypothetical protein